MSGLELRTTTTSYLDAFLERILDLSDYFVYRKRISLSEGFMHWLVLSRAVWYSLYGATGGGVVDLLFPSRVWVALFWLLAVGQFAAFFSRSHLPRSAAAFTQGVVWAFLSVLSFMSNPASPAAPTFAVFSLVAVCLTVRLFREKRDAVDDAIA